jgi:FRG domain
MMAATKEIKSVQELLAEFKDIKVLKQAHGHVRVWFRGQPTSGLPLIPGVYRPNFRATSEADRLKTEQHLTQEFRIESSGLRLGRDTPAEIYFLQQHYKMPTRLLDWTTNPLAALYFAAKDDPTVDGELFLMDAYQLANKRKIAKDFLGVGSQRNPIFKNALDVIFGWKTLENFPNFIMPIRPDYIDTRVNSQSSCFTFHVPKRSVLTPDENDTLLSFRIPSASKETILTELFSLRVDEFSIFGDLEGLSRRLRTAHSIT